MAAFGRSRRERVNGRKTYQIQAPSADKANSQPSAAVTPALSEIRSSTLL